MWEEKEEEEKKKTVGQAAIIPSIQSRNFDPILALVRMKEKYMFSDGFSDFFTLLGSLVHS